MISDYKIANEVINKLIPGMTLDSIHAYGVLIVLELFRVNAASLNKPVSVKIEITGDLQINSISKANHIAVDKGIDFFLARANALPDLYALIGQEITSARVTNLNELELISNGKLILAKADVDPYEVVWEVKSDTSIDKEKNLWSVLLDDSNTLHVLYPEMLPD
jgi:hypothetical protein